MACADAAAPSVDVQPDAGVRPDVVGDLPECEPNTCGGCGPLAAVPGDACGRCDTGHWACTDTGNVRCVGDLGQLALNECGGCSTLGQRPDLPCGTCQSGRTVCLGPDDVACFGDTGDLVRNACLGCGPLEGRPGSACGTCGSGQLVCASSERVDCHGDRGANALNACGGCAALDADPGAPCGQCGRWECAGQDGVVCLGDDPNPCGGCGPLAATLGETCGTCGSGTYVCGQSDAVCDGDRGAEASNGCGGCSTLPRPSEPCGPCLFGAWACTSDDAMECVDDRGECIRGHVEIAAGSFLRGSPLYETCRSDDEALHEVRLTGSLWVAAFEVTRSEWSELLGGPAGSCPTCPVDQVGLFDAAAYANALSSRQGLVACYGLEGCDSAPGRGCAGDHCDGMRCEGLRLVPDCDGYRLPTEAQWEYVARAGTEGGTWSGDLDARGCDSPDPVLRAIAWSCHDPVDAVQPVGLKAANPWRVFDMLGNAAEWTQDGYAPYPTDPAVDPVVPLGQFGVVRGGHVHLAGCALRAARRAPVHPWRRQRAVGFRLVR